MAGNLQVQETLYNEIQSVVGEGPPTAEHLARMPYLRSCIKESFRYIVATHQSQADCFYLQ